ncbi:methylthioribose-1-phosphate isomerase [Thermanaeromonas toyohensis ToBE]|uniref:Methylthioribose-1-phosphate isomerase n=1 Tax=Thermanaeromonas toyohensis ToBE TaxID=698762 RepID=A0A1W1W361_9FIRM|nr:S-methyl-5-thioribose-1-phosphate isomerase [Thermanaeromonas toyohensis]SMC00058.1 methylthioribose-1-phosphate isomerase [Thermanaeromonas toyohensis ToBE]
MPEPVSPIVWRDGELEIIDQTRLPEELVFIRPRTVEEVWKAIRELKVRGAPALGIAAAFGLYLAIKDFQAKGEEELCAQLKKAADYLASSRPTAVNLFWALKRVQEKVARAQGLGVEKIKELVLREALAIQQEDESMCLAIGRYGAELLKEAQAILTHCNAGTLATARYGTALAPVYYLATQGKVLRVFVDETRPLLQGARLTAWELKQAGIPVTLITDSMAAVVMQKGWVQAVVVGADRIAANGDVANKIGTYGLAILAREHGLPFYVAAPSSTFDLTLATGEEIPIEEREPAEITHLGLRPIAPQGIAVFNPAFDVTPHHYITAIITEKGILRPPYQESISQVLFKEAARQK